MTKESLPRILLLTTESPGARYGTGEVIRRITSYMPADQIFWACLSSRGGQPELPCCQTKEFPSRTLHWRLNAGLWQYLFMRTQARGIARDICSWARDFKPELLWVCPGMDCVIVARYLEQMLGIPVHMTVHDAFEMNRVFKRHSYLYGVFERDVAALLKKVVTMDAVSRELVEHVQAGFITNFSGTMVFPPSTDVSKLPQSAVTPDWSGNVRRIGLCGNPRVEQRQWNEFIGVLSRLPFDFEIHVFGNAEVMVQSTYPSNVRLISLGFAQSEADIIAHFHHSGVSVCYLGLYTDEKQAFLGRTSLSSKLTTYVAAGCPVCIDGPEGSVAWRLVSEYDAGLIVNTGPGGAEDLLELLSNRDVWIRKSEGSRRLCVTEMDLAVNTGRLMDLMSLAGRSAFESSSGYSHEL